MTTSPLFFSSFTAPVLLWDPKATSTPGGSSWSESNPPSSLPSQANFSSLHRRIVPARIQTPIRAILFFFKIHLSNVRNVLISCTFFYHGFFCLEFPRLFPFSTFFDDSCVGKIIIFNVHLRFSTIVSPPTALVPLIL